MNWKSSERAPLVQLVAAFAAGALLAYLLDRSWMRRHETAPCDDGQLRERVRARVAELVSYPDAIDVAIEGGLVCVSGHVLASESDRLLSRLTQLPGVHKVYNALDRVDDATAAGCPGPGPSLRS